MAVAVVWAAACGDADPDITGPTPVRNRAPQAVDAIPAQTAARLYMGCAIHGLAQPSRSQMANISHICEAL